MEFNFWVSNPSNYNRLLFLGVYQSQRDIVNTDCQTQLPSDEQVEAVKLLQCAVHPEQAAVSRCLFLRL